MLESLLYAFAAGIGGTGIGGVLASMLRPGEKQLYFVINFAAGIMVAAVCFDMVPASVELSGLFVTAAAMVAGIAAIALLDRFITARTNSRTGFGALMGIAIALHDFPEGLAIGASGSIEGLGLTVSILIAIHNIPEGLAMAAPMRLGKMKRAWIIFYTALTGLPTGIGAILGSLATTVDTRAVGVSIACAAGAMAYLTFIRMLASDGAQGIWGALIGIMCGLFITYGL
ncbi:MAG TPA: ZIP family metal transporter [Clostridia bacterium]|nr:ZIP family metal transporter [Clostridia bacterium]